jgi:hypothetical protein
VNEVNGVWGTAEAVSGAGLYAQVNSISCGSAGNCAAGGRWYVSGNHLPFVVDEVNGTWGTAETIPGSATLNAADGGAEVNSISCASAGNCAAGGFYTTRYTNFTGYDQAFVADEVNGTWQTAEEVPGTAALNTGHDAQVSSISCASAGNCTAGGYYTGGSSAKGSYQAFVVDEVGGTWGNADTVPVSADNGTAQINSISCPAAGECAGGGTSGSDEAAFLVDQVPGHSLTVSVNGSGLVSSTPSAITCPGTCSAAFGVGTAVALHETPAAGWHFAGWGGNCSGTSACGVTLNSDQAVTAKFLENSSAVTIPSSALSVSGKAAQITSILKSGGYPASVSAPTAGAMTIVWYYLPAGAHLARAPKPVVIARGSKSFSAAGKGTIKLRLTAQGRKLLKKSKRIKLTAVGTFAPKHGKKTSKSKTITLAHGT